MAAITFGEFSRAFRENIRCRSRTAKGVSDVSSSEKKRPLLKSGSELAATVAENAALLIRSIWDDRGLLPAVGSDVRALMEGWYDLTNRGLQDPEAYRAEYERLAEEAESLSDATGREWRVNPRYRVWTVPYTTRNIAPLELEFAMDEFYEAIVGKIRQARDGKISQAELLAYADVMIDGEVHPWLDGCGRNATAAVMWLSVLVPGYRLPAFGPRDEHYRTIHDLSAHAAYYTRCLGRFLDAELL